jgi:hypothetical protein
LLEQNDSYLLRLSALKIDVHCKFKLVDIDFFELFDIILFIKNKHGLLVFNQIDYQERNGTVRIANKNRIADNSCRSFSLFLVK